MGITSFPRKTKYIMEAVSQESVCGAPEPSGARKSSKGGRHPAYNVMVRRAIFNLKSKNGSSRKAILRFICSHYSVKKTSALKAVGRALKRMVRSGLLYKSKAGSYKLTGKGRKSRKARRTRRRKAAKKAGRRRKSAKKSKKAKKAKKSKKARKGRKVNRRRKSVKKTTKRRKASKKTARKGRKSTRRRH